MSTTKINMLFMGFVSLPFGTMKMDTRGRYMGKEPIVLSSTIAKPLSINSNECTEFSSLEQINSLLGVSIPEEKKII